jgi:RNA polymerase sigma factor (sigma-70 family)
MAARKPSRKPADGDFTYRKLVEAVVAGDEAAWQEFVERFSNLIFSLLWRYANGDQDQCADLYLYVIEGLHQTSDSGETFYRLRRYLASVEEYQGKGRLTTWLGRVTQNLVSDHFREQEGRRTLPRAIQRLDLPSQRIFKLLYWDCLPEREAWAILESESGGFERERFDRAVVIINRSLKTCNRWSIFSEVIRRTPALPIHPIAADGEEGTKAVQLADPDPESQPHESTVSKLEQGQARAMGALLIQKIGELSTEERLLLICRFKHGMTAGQIAGLLGREDEKRIYVEIDRIKDQLRTELRAAGFEWQNFSIGIEVLDGLLDQVDAHVDG